MVPSPDRLAAPASADCRARRFATNQQPVCSPRLDHQNAPKLSLLSLPHSSSNLPLLFGNRSLLPDPTIELRTKGDLPGPYSPLHLLDQLPNLGSLSVQP